MIDVTRTFTVDRPVSTVVGYLRDWGNSREWDPGTITCTTISGGPVGVGTEWRNVLSLLGRRVVVVFRLDCDEDDRLVFSGWNRGATSTDTIVCTALGGGGTSINYDSHVALRGPASLAGPLLAWEFERIGDKLVGQLTAALRKVG